MPTGPCGQGSSATNGAGGRKFLSAFKNREVGENHAGRGAETEGGGQNRPPGGLARLPAAQRQSSGTTAAGCGASITWRSGRRVAPRRRARCLDHLAQWQRRTATAPPWPLGSGRLAEDPIDARPADAEAPCDLGRADALRLQLYHLVSLVACGRRPALVFALRLRLGDPLALAL